MGPGSVPGRGTKIPQAAWHGQRKRQNKMEKQAGKVQYPPVKTDFKIFWQCQPGLEGAPHLGRTKL